MLGRSRLGAHAAAVMLGMVLASGAADAMPRDRHAPTAPTELRVLATTPYSVTMTWNPSTDRSGIVSYTICCTSTSSEIVPGTTTTHTFTRGVEAARTYTFVVYAKDGAGNVSKPSNSVTVTTPADTTPPSRPSVTVTSSGSTHVALAWSAVDDGPFVWFSVYLDGAPTSVQGTRDTGATFAPLASATTYTFTVVARDFANNTSESDPVTVTTAPFDETDRTPPTTPANFHGDPVDSAEIWFSWSPSIDDRSPQSRIEYRIYRNGEFLFSVFGTTSGIDYGIPGTRNIFELIAVDESGNGSEPAVLIIDL